MKKHTLLFLVKNDEVLLALKKRGVGKGYWNGVGGKLESGEDFQKAAIRECLEEICVEPKKLENVAELYFDFYHEKKKLKHYVIVFLCKDWVGAPKETEEMAPKWFDKSDLPFDKMWDDDKYWLPKVLGGQNLKAHFKLNEKDKVIENSFAPLD